MNEPVGVDAPYGFDAAKLRAARSAAGASVARIAAAAGVTERAVSLYLAGGRVPRPEILPRLAAAVGVTPADLCTVDRERLVHLRVCTGRSRAAMAAALGMAATTYRELETTGRRGRLSRSHYDPAQDRWLAWDDWAAPIFAVTPERLAAAVQATREHADAERAERWRLLCERDPERAAHIDRVITDARRLPH
ncbi:helix-turn-helix domain-containing protein [Streptomyces sp. NPDC047049]|uniref:helix-turn-helix domain-containing protein n=1 Tax=Streptomyces sp. NPDC047049 TaxID=3156688 RepID=UPI0033F9F0E1